MARNEYRQGGGACRRLRGDFYPSDSGSSRSEQLSYRGVHFVEAFLVRKRDSGLVGQSEPFYVVIEYCRQVCRLSQSKAQARQ
jgi:hypothetical protein